ncbi:hypothetical protein J6590_046237 [Homalodisca vitripennis]|nr:hypothetical protein J6590_046237 [Homalodisca vitripennis]
MVESISESGREMDRSNYKPDGYVGVFGVATTIEHVLLSSEVRFVAGNTRGTSCWLAINLFNPIKNNLYLQKVGFETVVGNTDRIGSRLLVRLGKDSHPRARYQRRIKGKSGSREILRQFPV